MKKTMMDWKKRGCIIAFLVLLVLCMGMNFAMEKKVETLQHEGSKQNEVPIREPIMEPIQEQVLSKEETKQAVEETANKKREYKNWHATTVGIEKDYKTAYVIVQYTNVSVTPTEALIYTPDCTQFFSNISMNETKTGEIVFELKNPQKGVWQILLLDEINLGTYLPYVLEKEEYEARKLGQDEERVVPY